MASSSLKRNTFYNVSSAVLPLVISLLTTPYLLGALGNARYGIIALVWLLFNYFGLFDFGLSQATSNRLAKPQNSAVPRQAEIVWTALAVNAFFGLVGGGIFYLAADPIFSRLASIPPDIAKELSGSIVWFAVLVPTSTVNAVFTGVLESRERFRVLNAWQVAGSIAGQLGPLTAIHVLGPSLEVALAATACARLVFMLPVAWVALEQIRWQRVRPRLIVVKDLLSYGGWISASNLVSPILASADQFLIGSMLGVAAVPLYSIPFSLAQKILIVPGALMRAMFPRLSRADAEGAASQAAGALGLIGWGLALICVPGMFLMEAVLHLWLGVRFSEQASSVGRVLLLGIWANGIASVPYMLLQSQGRPDLPAKLHWLELLPFLAVLWACIHSFGLVGAAIAWVLRVSADGIGLLYFAGFLRSAFRRFLAPFVVVFLSLAWTSFTSSGFLWSAILAIASGIVLAILAGVQEPEVRRIASLVASRR